MIRKSKDQIIEMLDNEKLTIPDTRVLASLREMVLLYSTPAHDELSITLLDTYDIEKEKYLRKFQEAVEYVNDNNNLVAFKPEPHKWANKAENLGITSSDIISIYLLTANDEKKKEFISTYFKYDDTLQTTYTNMKTQDDFHVNTISFLDIIHHSEHFLDYSKYNITPEKYYNLFTVIDDYYKKQGRDYSDLREYLKYKIQDHAYKDSYFYTQNLIENLKDDNKFSVNKNTVDTYVKSLVSYMNKDYYNRSIENRLTRYKCLEELLSSNMYDEQIAKESTNIIKKIEDPELRSKFKTFIEMRQISLDSSIAKTQEQNDDIVFGDISNYKIKEIYNSISDNALKSDFKMLINTFSEALNEAKTEKDTYQTRSVNSYDDDKEARTPSTKRPTPF
jgi:hypothetical protein